MSQPNSPKSPSFFGSSKSAETFKSPIRGDECFQESYKNFDNGSKVQAQKKLNFMIMKLDLASRARAVTDSLQSSKDSKIFGHCSCSVRRKLMTFYVTMSVLADLVAWPILILQLNSLSKTWGRHSNHECVACSDLIPFCLFVLFQLPLVLVTQFYCRDSELDLSTRHRDLVYEWLARLTFPSVFCAIMFSMKGSTNKENFIQSIIGWVFFAGSSIAYVAFVWIILTP
mmetsp:Transcript_3341/g.6789  ORF Transcript_3341/g.6789 Transcript_3341/m.6789 type:complete len:228 (+) Transcript_3341:165-848(+)